MAEEPPFPPIPSRSAEIPWESSSPEADPDDGPDVLGLALESLERRLALLESRPVQAPDAAGIVQDVLALVRVDMEKASEEQESSARALEQLERRVQELESRPLPQLILPDLPDTEAHGRTPMQWLPTSAATVYMSALSSSTSAKMVPGPISLSWVGTVPSRKLFPPETPISTALRLCAYSSMTALSTPSRSRPVRSSLSVRTTSTTRTPYSFARAIVSPIVSGSFSATTLFRSAIFFSPVCAQRPVEEA